MPIDLLSLDPVPTLLARTREALSADFDLADPRRPARVSRAPGRLDVMGGIADYTGSLVCEATLDRASAVILQTRGDREVQVFSFNLFDEHKPFTARVPLDALANRSTAELRADFAEPGRRFAGYLAGCLHLLHRSGLIDLADPAVRGVNIAVYSTVPLGAGVSSSAAIEVSTMLNLIDHFGLRDGGKAVTPMSVAAMCQAVENQVVGAPCGIMDQATSCAGREGALLRMVCQPHELLEPLVLPRGVRAVGINSAVKHSVGGGQYGKTRCAAFMGHAIILDTMRRMGEAAGRQLVADPMNGYLANLDPDDYKQSFRPQIPEFLTGRAFLDRYGKTIDTATTVEPEVEYPVQHATDHHVLEARRVRRFVEFLTQADAATTPADRKAALDRAGHLMYASHLSYTNDAFLGADECDLLVDLVRRNESAGLYGAKITGGGSGGTVAILCDAGEKADEAIARIMAEYEQKTGKTPDVFRGSSPGAWEAGTALVG